MILLECRYAADPVLNRGVTLESLGRYEEAAADYQAVLLAQPNDPAAWNNLGNVKVCRIVPLFMHPNCTSSWVTVEDSRPCRSFRCKFMWWGDSFHALTFVCRQLWDNMTKLCQTTGGLFNLRQNSHLQLLITHWYGYFHFYLFN